MRSCRANFRHSDEDGVEVGSGGVLLLADDSEHDRGCYAEAPWSSATHRSGATAADLATTCWC